jgi:hypothetical protein
MAVGEVEVRIVNADTTLIAAAVADMRTGASDDWLMSSSGPENQQVIIVNIEGA